MNRRPPAAAPRWLAVGLVVIAVLVALQQERQQPANPPDQTDRETVSQPGSRETLDRPRDPENTPQPDRDREPFLRDIGGDRLESPAGLIYRRGGAEGHRLDHVLQHAEDNPSKPVHGVFRGDRDTILRVIDEAYRIAQTRGPPAAIVEKEGDRTIQTVDLNRDVGYLGGASGARRNHPPLRHVRLVLEGRDVITAYPVRP